MALVEELGKALVALLEKGQKRYRNLRAVAAILVLVFSLILGLIIGTFVPQGSSSVGQAAQSLIGVAGFLAAASGVIAFFYSGKLLEFVNASSSLMVALRPVLGAEFEAVAKKEFERRVKELSEKINFSRPLTQKEIAQTWKVIQKALLETAKNLFEGSGKLVKELTAPARRMAYYAAFVLVALVVSAFFSTLAILSGSAQYLGSAFGFIALGSGFLALAWSDAHVNLTRFLTAVLAHESVKAQPVAQGQTQLPA